MNGGQEAQLPAQLVGKASLGGLLFSQHASAVELYEGELFVLLPCEFPTFELDRHTVVWRRSDQHQLQGDQLKDQTQRYSGRTSMTDALETGDLSLNLTNLQISDSATYTCSIISFRGDWRLRDVPLQVKGQHQTKTLPKTITVTQIELLILSQ
ncbi:unnamed protein product [Oreochromis niloticus]|nr:unnamed protein product [Mustela putorius furo]